MESIKNSAEVPDLNILVNDLNDDLEIIITGLFNGKLWSKQGNEIIFSHNKNTSLYPIVHFYDKAVNSIKIHKHLGMVLDLKLDFKDHIKSVWCE